MVKSKAAMKIPIANLFAILSYTYPDLMDETKDEEESMFNSLDEMLSEILLRGILRQLKKGLYKTYVSHEEALTMIRGKIDMHDSIRLKTQLSRQLYCKFDEFDKDNFYNQVLKSTCLLIIRQGRVCQRKRKKLRDILFFFNEISEIQLKSIVWEDIRFHKDKIAYRSLISLCYLIYKGVSENEETEQSYITALAMSDLYGRFMQHFILKECPNLHLSYQGKSLASMQERATGMKSALAIDMLLSDPNVLCVFSNHYHVELLQADKNPQKSQLIYEGMEKVMRGLSQEEEKMAAKEDMAPKRLMGIFLYPSLEENYLEAYSMADKTVYLGAINLTLPFQQLRLQLIQIAQLGR